MPRSQQPSKNDTREVWIRRTVQSGGKIRYAHAWYIHPNLLEHIGHEVLVHDAGFGADIDVIECLYLGGTSRTARRYLRSNAPLWSPGRSIVNQLYPVEQ